MLPFDKFFSLISALTLKWRLRKLSRGQRQRGPTGHQVCAPAPPRTPCADLPVGQRSPNPCGPHPATRPQAATRNPQDQTPFRSFGDNETQASVLLMES